MAPPKKVGGAAAANKKAAAANQPTYKGKSIVRWRTATTRRIHLAMIASCS